MIIQSLIAKVALVTLATGIVGSSIAVPVVLASGGGKDKQIKTKRLEGPDPNECFEIPAEGGGNQAKLLICQGKNSLKDGSGNDDYWYLEGDGKNTKVTTINKKSGGLEITFEGSHSPAKETLKVKGGNWKNIPDSTDLSDCSLTTDREEAKIQCLERGDDAYISLTKFEGK